MSGALLHSLTRSLTHSPRLSTTPLPIHSLTNFFYYSFPPILNTTTLLFLLYVSEYESARPDILAQEIPTLLPRLNIAKQYELRLLCKHILKIPDDVESVTLQTIDKLGIDIRTMQGETHSHTYNQTVFCY